ncbi:thiamine-phosphate pyrophosphorylase [Candidatus Omnitrophota bacterium]
MGKNSIDKNILRILDANINRLKEGLRVCEDEVRFVLNSRNHTRQFKAIRHEIVDLVTQAPFSFASLMQSRDSLHDVGRKSQHSEFKRSNDLDIFLANIQRSKESIRVIEEFFKLIDKRLAEKSKGVRYKIYDLEKKVILSQYK